MKRQVKKYQKPNISSVKIYETSMGMEILSTCWNGGQYNMSGVCRS